MEVVMQMMYSYSLELLAAAVGHGVVSFVK